MTDSLGHISSLDLRDELETLVRRDLLGPAGGPDEIVDEPTVRGRYIAGMLAPRGEQLRGPDDLPDPPDERGELALAGPDTDDGKADADTPLPDFAAMLPSSMGLTFCVADAATHIQITVRWGKYRRVRSEAVLDTEGAPKLVWQRSQVEATSEPIALDTDFIDPWIPDSESPQVYVRGLVRRRVGPTTVTLFLVNGQREPEKRKDEAWLFQPEIVVCAPDSAPIFARRALPAMLNHGDDEDRVMSMLYRREVDFAAGHGVGVEVTLAPGEWERAVEVRTSVMPSYEVERMESPAPEQMPALAHVVVDMKTLAETPLGGFAAALAPLADAYDDWIAVQEARLQTEPDLEPFQGDGAHTLATCREALARIRAGIGLLDADTQAAAAFQFANKAMWDQRVRSEYSRRVRQGALSANGGESPETLLASIDVPANRSWRPFQLAFILLNLPPLVDPRHPERTDPTGAYADLLWFPTGGGKTEAYLGVAAFTMAIRRLQGEIGGRSGAAGVAVLMRYTLRLLTLQQFQRAAALMCACELMRCEDPARWGDEPFRIGLWVGRRSTPNWTSEAEEAIKQDRNSGWSGSVGGSGTPAQLTNCPWCGHPIDPGKDIIVETPEKGRGRTFQFCGDPLGQCPFSRRQSPDEGLPIVVVDEEIYRRLPALLIATVDKFAQMAWKGETQMLFGQVNGYCPRHGYRSPEIVDSDSHTKKGDLPASRTEPRAPLRPPDLIIQDELHLISGPLGTLVGLYETAVDALASWTVDGVTVRPKVIASTATIRRARHQVHSLFLREVKIFPPAALDAGNNFFARRQPSSSQSPGRCYIGVCASGTRLKTVLIRVYVAFMAAAQTLYEKYGKAADPYLTLVGYFNSLRELGGMKRVVDDAVRTRLLRIESRGLKKRAINPDTIEELTSRKSATDIPHILDRLETVFPPPGVKPERGKQPLDVVLATNMISVGVDVGRLGLMVVASQPKATAEYIQATSRVGRSFPGIVCTVYNWARPRDLSHYERFSHYHATFYQQVEALSVTPFSPRALDRGLTGVLVAAMRLQGEAYNANARAGALDLPDEAAELAVRAISARVGQVNRSTQNEAEVQSMLQTRLEQWVAEARAVTGGAVLGYQARKDGKTRGLLKQPTEEEWGVFTCLNSLRDVEPSVALVLNDYAMDSESGLAPDDEGA